MGERLLELLGGGQIVVGRGEQTGAQAAHAPAPFGHGGGRFPFTAGVGQQAQQRGETAEHFEMGVIARPRADALPQAGAIGHQPAQRQPLDALLPGKQAARVAVAGAHFAVAAPADIETGHRVVQQRQIFAAQTEALEHDAAFQQRQQFFRFKTALQQRQRGFERIQQRLAARQAHVGHRIRQRPAVGAAAEHRFDKGQIRLNMRREHGDIVRLPVGMFRQQRQQAVFQNLQLAQRAVGAVDFDAGIRAQMRDNGVCVFARQPVFV